MKKYIVRNKITNEVFGEFDTRKKANSELVRYVTAMNDFTYSNREDFLDVFDFEIVEGDRDINSYEEAKEYLGLDGGSIDLVSIADKRYQRACSAFSKLLTIADAWNKQDGFIPDFSDISQYKFYPWFVYSKDAAGFVCSDANRSIGSPHLGSKLCFATPERALAFGKKFEELYNDFLLVE